MLYIILISIFILLIIILILRSNFELKSLNVKKIDIVDDKINNGLKLTFISDLHENDFGDDNKKLIETIYSLDNNLIVIGGDLPVAYKFKGDLDKCSSKVSIKFLENLSKNNNKILYFVLSSLPSLDSI